MRAKIDKLIDITNYVEQYVGDNGYAPSIREIALYFKISISTAHSYIMKMNDNGMLSTSPMKNRSIVTDRTLKMRDKTIKIPLVGRIACGMPLTAIENIEEFITLSEALIGTGEFFMLRAYGDSMIDAGINQGDLVIIRQQNTAEEGEIIVALIEDEATLKRYYPEPHNRRIRLHPENPAMQDIYVDNCNIQGVAVKVIKDAY